MPTSTRFVTDTSKTGIRCGSCRALLFKAADGAIAATGSGKRVGELLISNFTLP